MLMFDADTVLAMGCSGKSRVFNFVILLNSRKLDARDIFMFHSRPCLTTATATNTSILWPLYWTTCISQHPRVNNQRILLEQSYNARVPLLTASSIFRLGRRLLLQLQPFNGLFSRTTWVSQYQKGKTNLDFTGARDSDWQWHQLSHMQVCTSLQTDNHASTPPLCFLQAGCPSCRPTNSVKALKGLTQHIIYTKFSAHEIYLTNRLLDKHEAVVFTLCQQ